MTPLGFKPNGRLYLEKETGATVWDPKGNPKERTGKMAGGALSPQQRMGLQQRATIPSGAVPPRPMRAAGGKTHTSG